jgi:DNA-binding GntR family transcriptional regulator
MKAPLPHTKGGRVIADWVTDTLQAAIVSGHFEPGEKLDQDLIAKELDVSLTPVREAIRRLESDGFIKVRPYRGAFIAKITKQDIHETYELRKLLEAEVVRQVTPLISDSALDELEATLREAQAQFDAGDHSGHYECDVQFHGTIINLVENTLLKEVLDSIIDRISTVRRFGQLKAGPHLVASFSEHQGILQAMRRRDPEKAAELMRLHMGESALRIQELVNE